MEDKTRLEKITAYRASLILNDIPQLPNRQVFIYWDEDGNEIGRKDPALQFKDILGLDDRRNQELI